MEIREFRLSDYEEVIALWDKAGLLASRSDERNEIEKKLERDPDLFLVGIDAEAIVAAVMGGYDGRRGWVYHLAVDPTLHASGLGTQLLEELESRLRAKGCIKINLLVERENAGVRDFYARRGYAVDDLIFMEKWLA
ncbi:MAG: GNAT family acetyltransferase [Propionivibrio sp.]|nr:GNAT family acetyltransferase [Propionivibrio sp.]